MLDCDRMMTDVMARGPLRVAAQHRWRAALAAALLAGCGSSGPAPASTDPLAGAGGDGSLAAPPEASAEGAAPSNTSESPAATPGRAAGEAEPGSAIEPPAAAPDGSTNAPLPMTPGVYAGTYFVPVPSELEVFALFDVERIRLDVRGGELVLQYDLPELLLGEARGLSFRGTQAHDGSYSLGGADGVVNCRASGDGWVCDEVLQSAELDLDKIDRMLDALPEAEATARRSVASQFADDPIGVLRIQP